MTYICKEVHGNDDDDRQPRVDHRIDAFTQHLKHLHGKDKSIQKSKTGTEAMQSYWASILVAFIIYIFAEWLQVEQIIESGHHQNETTDFTDGSGDRHAIPRQQ